ncbi:MAG: hypothetical protein U0235_18180 [Polyangiaceae bacterium]
MNKLAIALTATLACFAFACGTAPSPETDDVDVEVSEKIETQSYTLYECTKTGQTFSSSATCKAYCSGGYCINIGYCTSPGHCVYR